MISFVKVIIVGMGWIAGISTVLQLKINFTYNYIIINYGLILKDNNLVIPDVVEHFQKLLEVCMMTYVIILSIVIAFVFCIVLMKISSITKDKEWEDEQQSNYLDEHYSFKHLKQPNHFILPLICLK